MPNSSAVCPSDLFHFEEDKPSFESYGRQNGFHYWLASDLATMLGYDDGKTFGKAINKAIGVCMTLGIPVAENFEQTTNSRSESDYKLSRFACYLTAMNADVRRPQVAAAQAYFAVQAEAFRQYIDSNDGVERVHLRGKITEHEKSLGGVVKNRGVQEYGLFQNAGYRGMYNMNLKALKLRKGIPDEKRSLLDFMGETELAANLFRITQTEAKIVNENLSGQARLEQAAESVGREVRNTMIKISGAAPEMLPLAEDINAVRKGIKGTQRHLAKLDKPKKT